VSRSTDIHRSQDREDVGLQEGHQHFESGEEDEHEQWQHTHRDECRIAFSLEQGLGQQCEGHEQNVTSQHVGEKTNGERERAHQEGRNEFDRCHQDVERLRNSGWEQRVL